MVKQRRDFCERACLPYGWAGVSIQDSIAEVIATRHQQHGGDLDHLLDEDGELDEDPIVSALAVSEGVDPKSNWVNLLVRTEMERRREEIGACEPH